MTTDKRKSERSTRDKLRSPGRPPVWQRENLCQFWRGVAAGHSSEVSAVEAGVSGPVGIRWFRSSGGMPPTHIAPSATSLRHCHVNSMIGVPTDNSLRMRKISYARHRFPPTIIQRAV